MLSEKKHKGLLKKSTEFITIKPNEKKLIRFQFKDYPVYIKIGQRIIIDDTKFKATGIINEIYYQKFKK